MSFVYHRVPREMKGSVLHPLNRLKDSDPELYAKYYEKYSTRPQVPLQRIPKIDCLWNDVIHSSAIHPYLIFEELKKYEPKLNPEIRYFKIPLDRFAAGDVVVFHYKPELAARHPKPEEDFEFVTAESFTAPSSLRTETKQYYSECYAAGKKPLSFVFVPHVLIRSSIETMELETIAWGNTR